jgi:hypothetical protein
MNQRVGVGTTADIGEKVCDGDGRRCVVEVDIDGKYLLSKNTIKNFYPNFLFST